MNKKALTEFVKRPRIVCLCKDCRQPRIKVNGEYPKAPKEMVLKTGHICCRTFWTSKDPFDGCSMGVPYEL